jgi:hypothetical protein
MSKTVADVCWVPPFGSSMSPFEAERCTQPGLVCWAAANAETRRRPATAAGTERVRRLVGMATPERAGGGRD